MPTFRDAFRSRRVAFLIALGFASGLPNPLSQSTLGLWLRSVGVDLGTIGLFALVALPYNFKFLWAPILDRFGLPWLGRRRGWIALAQLLCAGALVWMSVLDARGDAAWIGLAAVALAFLSASQDVVVDAYRADVLPDAERASGAASYVSGYRIAVVVATSGALVLADTIGWRVVYVTMAALMLLSVVATRLAPEPEGVRPPRTLGEAVTRPLADLFGRPGVGWAIAFVAFYKLGDQVLENMSGPFLKDIGFSLTEIGTLRKLTAAGATIAGTLVGGGLTPRLGAWRALLLFGVLQASTNFAYLALALVGKSYPLLVGAVAMDQFSGGMATASFVAFLMGLCHRSFSATQYALLSSASSLLGYRLVGAWSGYVAKDVGWPAFFALTAAAALPGLVLLLVTRTRYRAGADPGSPAAETA